MVPFWFDRLYLILLSLVLLCQGFRAATPHCKQLTIAGPLHQVQLNAALESEKVFCPCSIHERLAKAEAVSSRLEMVLDIVAANEKERLQHAHSLRMLQESNNRFAEQLQQMSTGFVQAMAKLGDAFGAVSATAGAVTQEEMPEQKSLSLNGRSILSAQKSSTAPIETGAERLLGIRQAVRIVPTFLCVGMIVLRLPYFGTVAPVRACGQCTGIQVAENGEGVAGLISRSIEEGLRLAHDAATRAAEASAGLQEQAHRIAAERKQIDDMSLASRVELGRVRELVGAATLPFGAALQVCAVAYFNWASSARFSFACTRRAFTLLQITREPRTYLMHSMV